MANLRCSWQEQRDRDPRIVHREQELGQHSKLRQQGRRKEPEQENNLFISTQFGEVFLLKFQKLILFLIYFWQNRVVICTFKFLQSKANKTFIYFV